MSRRMVPPLLSRPRSGPVVGSLALLTVVGAVAGGGLGAVPVSAETEITIVPDEIIAGAPGTEIVIATEPVDPELQGLTCLVQAVAHNGASTHPGNVLLVRSGGGETEIPGIEESSEATVTDVHPIVLGEVIDFVVRFGADGMSSLAFSVTVDCPDDRGTSATSTTAPPPTVGGSTTASTTVPPTLPPPPEPAVEVPDPTTTAPPGSIERTVTDVETPDSTPATTASLDPTGLPEAPPAAAVPGAPSYTG